MSKKDYVVIDDENAASTDADGDESLAGEGSVTEHTDGTADTDEIGDSPAGHADSDVTATEDAPSTDAPSISDDTNTTDATDADANDADKTAISDGQPEGAASNESTDETDGGDPFTYLKRFSEDLSANVAEDTEEAEEAAGVEKQLVNDETEAAPADACETASGSSEAIADDMTQDGDQDASTETSVEGSSDEMASEGQADKGAVADAQPVISGIGGSDAPATSVTDASSHASSDKVPGFVKIPLAIGIAAVCAIGGFALGHFSGNAIGASPASVKTELSNEELSTVVGRVSFDGQTVDITAKEAIMLNDTLNGDSHNYPTADMVVATARSLIMQHDAEKRGIQATDEDLKQFAQGMLGSDDYDTIAKEYQIDTESLKALVKSSYVAQEVRKQIVGDNEPELAAPPAAPNEGESDVAKSEYYTYIIDAAGDEWDAEKQAWVDENGEFAQTLKSSKTFDPKAKTATYDDALGAYQILGSRYSAEASTYETLWNDYMREIFSQANITIYSLIS